MGRVPVLRAKGAEIETRRFHPFISFFFFFSLLKPCLWFEDQSSVLYFLFKGPIPNNPNTDIQDGGRSHAKDLEIVSRLIYFMYVRSEWTPYRANDRRGCWANVRSSSITASRNNHARFSENGTMVTNSTAWAKRMTVDLNVRSGLLVAIFELWPVMTERMPVANYDLLLLSECW